MNTISKMAIEQLEVDGHIGLSIELKKIIESQSKKLEIAVKALESASQYGTTGEDARDMHDEIQGAFAELSRLSGGESISAPDGTSK